MEIHFFFLCHSCAAYCLFCSSINEYSNLKDIIFCREKYVLFFLISENITSHTLCACQYCACNSSQKQGVGLGTAKLD
jgi:hypothetical protein